MIRLDPDSMKYTTFLTEEGLYSYKRMPIRNHASMDAYNFRFDKVTEHVKNQKRCVDNSFLYADTMEKAIIQTARYLSLMGSNGIIQNPYKFQFGSKEVEWAGAGFTIGADLVRPLAKHTAAVRTYPTPFSNTDLRSFMALLQQVAYCYAISPAVAKIRHLLKPSTQWNWTKEIDKVFENAKTVIAERVEEGLMLFDSSFHTGLLTDWCQEEIGHILCQKHFDCQTPETGPADLNCCKTRWGAGSATIPRPTTARQTGSSQAWSMHWRRPPTSPWGARASTFGTDHQPLIPIINGTNLENLKTPRQIRLMRWDLQSCRWFTSRVRTWVARTLSPGTGCATTTTRP